MSARNTSILLFIFPIAFSGVARADTTDAGWNSDFDGYIELQQRIFFYDNFPAQGNYYTSAAANPKWRLDDNANNSVVLDVFARHDFSDDSRTHEDVREAMWQHVSGAQEWRAGIGEVFWGVVESRHLVDIVNQRDFLERFDGDAKLGQPMVNWTLHGENNNLDIFVLPYFRELEFPGPGGRLRSPLPMAPALYDSDAGNRHVDAAFRWQYLAAGADFSLSYFNGTSRQPKYNFVYHNNQPMIQPEYFQLSQWGLEAQKSIGNCLLKGEAIYRDADPSSWAGVAGFEYTLNNIGNGDLGLVLEYLRDTAKTTPEETFNDDLFMGLRYSSNALSSTYILAGLYQDRLNGGRIFKLEANTRLSDKFTMTLEAWRFDQLSSLEAAAFFSRDDYMEIGVRYFLN